MSWRKQYKQFQFLPRCRAWHNVTATRNNKLHETYLLRTLGCIQVIIWGYIFIRIDYSVVDLF